MTEHKNISQEFNQNQQKGTLRAYCFFDAENVFYALRKILKARHTVYSPNLLSETIIEIIQNNPDQLRLPVDRNLFKHNNIKIERIFYYRGEPNKEYEPEKYSNLQKIIRAMKVHDKNNILTIKTLPFAYLHDVNENDKVNILHAREKGIDITIALDIYKYASEKQYDIALVFSQDQDLGAVLPYIRDVEQNQNKRIPIFSVFPRSEDNANMIPLGIRKTNHIGYSYKDYFKATIYAEGLEPTKKTLSPCPKN